MRAHAEMRAFQRRPRTPYCVGVDRRERVFALTTAAEAAVLAYGAAVAFLTPSARSEHNFVLSVALLCVAAPLAWHAVSKRASQAGPRRLPLVIVPNVVLLGRCFGGVFGSTANRDGAWPAQIALLAVTVMAAAFLLTRRQARAVARA